MKTTLFVVPGSHPSIAVAQMLEQKGITFRQIDLAPAIHRLVLRVLDFPGVTVPALVIESTRLQGSRRISRALDALRPEPRLFPTQPVRRAEVERAEAWGDLVLQDVPRRLAWWSLRRHPDAVESFMEGARLGVPSDVAAASAGPLIRLSARLNRADDAAIRGDLAALPGMLDRIDGWLDAGVLGDDPSNAADLQIATSVRLLMTLDDLRPAIEGRPAGKHALRTVPRLPGRVPAVLPREWLAPLG